MSENRLMLFKNDLIDLLQKYSDIDISCDVICDQKLYWKVDKETQKETGQEFKIFKNKLLGLLKEFNYSLTASKNQNGEIVLSANATIKECPLKMNKIYKHVGEICSGRNEAYIDKNFPKEKIDE